MAPPLEGKGREQSSLAAAFPFLFGRPGIHPGIFLFANLSLAVFMLTARKEPWIQVTPLWGGSLILVFLSPSRVGKILKRMGVALPFLGVSLFFHLFFTPGTVLFRLGPMYATLEGLRRGAWVTQKLAFFFWISLILPGGGSSLFLYRLMERASHLPLPERFRITIGILALYLILQWLRILPRSWAKQLRTITANAKGKREKFFLRLRALPRVLGHDLFTLDQWATLLIARGYGEGILRIAGTPMPPLQRKDTLVLGATLTAWGIWIAVIS